MNLKMSFLTTLSVALLAVTANAEIIIHESDFEAEPAVGFGLMADTMLFNDAGGDLIGFSANGNVQTTGDACGVSASNPNSGSFSYANDVGAADGFGATGAGSPNGWGAAWCGANTESGSGGFTTQAIAEENGAGCYVDFSAGATFTATCQIATDTLDPLTGTATGEVRLEFNSEADPNDPTTMRVPDVIPRVISTRLGVADLTSTYQTVTVSYTLTQADLDAGVAAGTPINSVSAVMGIEGAGFGSSDGLILFDDFVFEVDAAHVVVVGAGHAAVEPDAIKGDVDLSGVVDFADIAPFIGVLQSGGSQPEADCDCSTVVDFADIPEFIAILQGQ